MVPLDGSTNFVGLQFAVVGRLHADRKDLSFCLRVTELVTNQVVELQTNFNAGLRVQVPTGNRLLVVEQRPQSSRKVMAFLLEPPPL
jgi:hypothetical protein